MFDSCIPGEVVAEMQLPPISRLTLAMFCGASGDHNPVHVDVDFARAAGHDDVFAHGMLVMAYLSRLVPVDPAIHLDWLECRFVAVTRVGDALRCRARLVSRELVGERCKAELQLEAVAQDGAPRATGRALLSSVQVAAARPGESRM